MNKPEYAEIEGEVGTRTYRQFIVRDAALAVAAILFLYSFDIATRININWIVWTLGIIALVIAWRVKRPYGRVAKMFIALVRWFQIVQLETLAVIVGLMLVLDFASLGEWLSSRGFWFFAASIVAGVVTYKLFLGWSVLLETKDRIEIKQYRKIIVAIVVLQALVGLLGE